MRTLKYLARIVLALWLSSMPSLALLTMTSTAVIADSEIVLDSEFGEWDGQIYIDDPEGDATDPHAELGDILAFYWANNPDDETCYWMLERVPSNNTVFYMVLLDADNNGDYGDHEDRLVVVRYAANKKDSRVDMSVLYADSGDEISSVRRQDWGETSDEGGSRVEFGVSFDDLGITIGQTIRMYAVSFHGSLGNGKQAEAVGDIEDIRSVHIIDRVPDSGDVQWSPVSILGYPALAGAMVLGIAGIWFFIGRRKWPSRR